MDQQSSQTRQTLTAVIGIIILAVAVYADINAELSFTQVAREGIYERAYQQATVGVSHEGNHP